MEFVVEVTSGVSREYAAVCTCAHIRMSTASPRGNIVLQAVATLGREFEWFGRCVIKLRRTQQAE